MPERRHFLIPDLDALRRNVRNASGLERINIDRLYTCLKPDPDRPTREVYDLHWPLIYLLEGGEHARKNARSAVLTEALEGGPKKRPGHAWNRPEFFEMHLWISAAMAAHIAIAMDWLAVEGVFSDKEIADMGDHFVDGFWRYIYPHLKGKGRSPFFHPPINQDSAMVAGCLVIGRLFGHKWAQDPRAQRMYNDALPQAGNLIWQSSPSGFDGDGFTYMRLIQPPVLTLIAMVIEEVEGQDFFFAEFGPGRCSVASFMEHLQRFTLPSGYSFPHGRYGYVTVWNQYSQAYAARKTGDPHYLERILSMDQRYFITPWIAMDLPLAVVLAPYGETRGAPKKVFEPEYRTWHDEALWSNIGASIAKIQAHLSWRPGKLGTFILEHDRRRFILLTSEEHSQTNGLSFVDIRPTLKSGTGFEHLETAGVIIDKVQLRTQWEGDAIADHTRYLIVQENGICLFVDRFSAEREVTATYGLSLPSPITNGRVYSEDAGGGDIQLLCSMALSCEQKPWGKRKKNVFSRASGDLPLSRGGFVATLLNCSGQDIEAFHADDQGVTWRDNGGQECSLLLNPVYPAIQAKEDGRTDAILQLTCSNGCVFFSVKRHQSAGQHIWATNRINLSHFDRTVRIDRLEYGSYCRYIVQGLDIAVLTGSGYDIYAAASEPITLVLPKLSENPAIQINGSLVHGRITDTSVQIEIGPCNARQRGKQPVCRELLDPENMGLALDTLDAILRSHDCASLPIARALLEHQHLNVRLAAAETLGFLGTPDDAGLIAARLLKECELISPLNGLEPPWHGKWAFFPSVANMAYALRKLGNESAVDALQAALPTQYEPHAQGAIRMAIEALRPDTLSQSVKEQVCE